MIERGLRGEMVPSQERLEFEGDVISSLFTSQASLAAGVIQILRDMLDPARRLA